MGSVQVSEIRNKGFLSLLWTLDGVTDTGVAVVVCQVGVRELERETIMRRVFRRDRPEISRIE
jgi:hypothetical protein